MQVLPLGILSSHCSGHVERLRKETDPYLAQMDTPLFSGSQCLLRIRHEFFEYLFDNCGFLGNNECTKREHRDCYR